MKYRSKDHFLQLTDEAWQELWAALEDLTDSQICRHRKIGEAQGTESIKDVLAHLYAWHRLTLGWYRTGLKSTPELPAAGYNWRQTRELNRILAKQHQDVALDSIKRKLKLSHRQLVKLAESLPERQLMKAGTFAWTGKLPLSSYLGPNLASHYHWAVKKIGKLAKA